jgi:RNA polymerase I-specific transcription initiation factor RRN6
MADRFEPELPYGHFGLAEYDTHASEWRFTRSRPSQSPLRLLCVAQAPDKDPEDPSKATFGIVKKSARSLRYAQQIADLCNSLPGIHLPVELLPRYLALSESVQDASTYASANRGDLIAFSSLYSYISKRSVPVAVVAAGDNGNALRIIRTRMRRYHWEAPKESWLDMPALQGKETMWSSDAAPIQGLCISQSNERGRKTVLVRYLTSVYILKPEFSLSYGAGASLRLSTASSFHAHLMQWDSFADAAFNPWHSSQVGVINAEGLWGVIEVNNGVSKIICRDPRYDESQSTAAASRDGWARIAWIANVETLLVCTRSEILLFRVGEETGVLVQDVPLDMLASSPWIFDVRIFQERPAWFCVLTSTHLVLFQVSRSTLNPLPAKLKAKVRHFRNFEDLSLTMTLCEEEDREYSIFPCSYNVYTDLWQEALIALTSSTTSLNMTFRVLFTSDEAVMLEDPQQLPVAASHPHSSKTRRVLSLAIRTSTVQSLRAASPDDEHSTQASTRFYSFATLYSDMTISEALAISHQQETALDRQKITRPSFRLLRQDNRLRDVQDNFVVDSDSCDDTLPFRREPRPERCRRADARSKRDRYLKDFSGIARSLETTAPREVSQVLLDIAARATQLSADSPHAVRRLLDLAQQEVTTGDTEDAAGALERFREQMQDTVIKAADDDDKAAELRLVLERVPMLKAPIESEPQDDSLTSIYNRIVTTWISSLSPEISARTRVAKDHLARNVAAELMLSSLVVSTQRSTEVDNAESEEPSQGYKFELPMRGVPPTMGPFSSQLQSSQLPSSSALPTPSPTATPSVTTASSSGSIFAAPEVDRLRQYANFTKPAPAALPRALNNVLAHWELGTDIAAYDWLSISRRLARQDEEADEELSERDRLRMQKRAQRHLRRQRREAEASQALRLASSQVPELFSASQQSAAKAAESRRPPAAVATAANSLGAASSSQSIAPPVPASQPVPGRFAIRQPVKKKRKQGF